MVDGIGSLRLIEYETSPGSMHRHYESQAKVVAGKRKIDCIVWPPDAGIGDVDAFVDEIARTWSRITSRFEELCTSALPVLGAALLEYAPPCEEDGYVPPTAAELFATATFNAIRINATGEWRVNAHEVEFHDAAGSIGDCDIYLQLDGQLRVREVRFDG